jgi:GPI inositol-deacylase
MTNMFENPIYHRISLSQTIQMDFPRYGLYSYCEGTRCESHRRNQFTGENFYSLTMRQAKLPIDSRLGYPVLFIVGNADSYRQVRSLGSVAYRLGDNQRKQLDYFSIDFNEELSALFGGVLEQQTDFVIHAIQTILALYKTDRRIILVGNSIGGLLCRQLICSSMSIDIDCSKNNF